MTVAFSFLTLKYVQELPQDAAAEPRDKERSMHRHGVVVPSLLILFFLGTLTLFVGMLFPPARPTAPRVEINSGSVSPEALQQLRNHQTQHWRACLLNQQ